MFFSPSSSSSAVTRRSRSQERTTVPRDQALKHPWTSVMSSYLSSSSKPSAQACMSAYSMPLCTIFA